MTACALCPVYRVPVRDRREAEVGVACARCLTITDRDLADLATLASELPAMLPVRGGGQLGGGGHRAAGPRLPVSLDALTLMGPGSVAAPGEGALPPLVLLREEATRWAMLRGIGAEAREYVIGPDGRAVLPVVGLVALSTWLRNRLEWAAEYVPRFPRFALAVALCLGATRRVAGQAIPGAEPARRIGWCPAPGEEDGTQCLAELTASTWDDTIRCHECGAEYHRASGGWSMLAQSMKSTKSNLTRDREGRS